MARKKLATQGTSSTGDNHAPRQPVATADTTTPGFPAAGPVAFDQMVAAFKELEAAADRLGNSHAGRETMRHLLAWFDAVGLGLDAVNKTAVLTLINGVWGEFSGSGRDVMRDQLEASKR